MHRQNCASAPPRLCLRAGIRALTVPAMADLINGRVTLAAVRRVELEDLLGREPVRIEIDHVRMLLRGETVLVTGAGGSIGSSCAGRLHASRRGASCSSSKASSLCTACRKSFPRAFRDVETLPLVGDVKDARRLSQVLARPNHLGVPRRSLQARTSDGGSQRLAGDRQQRLWHLRASERVRKSLECSRFVLVSSDKAVNPANVMGASKRMAEMVCQALQNCTNTAMWSSASATFSEAPAA